MNFSITLNLSETGEHSYGSADEVKRFLTQLFHQNVPNFCLQASDITVTETTAPAQSEQPA